MSTRGGRGGRGGGRGGGGSGGGNANGRGQTQAKYEYRRPDQSAPTASSATPAPAPPPTATLTAASTPASAAKTTGPAAPVTKTLSEGSKRGLDLQPGWLNEARQINIAPYITRAAWVHLPEDKRIVTLRQIIRDLRKLLKMPHSRFWPSVLQDPSVAVFLDSYLRAAPRPFEAFAPRVPGGEADADDEDTDEGRTLETQLEQLFLKFFSRLVTRSESQTTLLSSEGYAKHVSKAGLVTTSLLMDLCAVFCPANTRLVQSIVQRAYDHMPLFFNMEAKETFKAITTAILKLSLNLTGPSSPLKDLASVLDMQNYLEDIAWTLKQFLDVCPAVATIQLAQTPDLLVALLRGYNGGLSAIGRVFSSLHTSSMVEEDFMSQHNRIRLLWTSVGFRVLNDRFFSRLGSKTGTDMAKLKDEFYETATVAIDVEQSDYEEFKHHLFMRDLNSRFKLSRTMREIDGHSHDPRLDFVCMALGDLSLNSAAPNPTAATSALTIEQQSSISAVKDVFPELGDGFVDQCLRHYQGQVESVINALLEDALPVPLRGLDRKMAIAAPALAPAPTPTAAAAKGRGKGKAEDDLVSSRKNVFANDDFDLLSRGAGDNLSSIRIKNKKDTVDAKSFLGGASSSSASSNPVDRERILQTQYGTYEDEYDDTFDGEDVGALKVDAAADDTDLYNPLMMFERPVVLQLLQTFNDTPAVFDKTSEARRSPARKKLLGQVKLTNEQVEGWHLMMVRHSPEPKAVAEFLDVDESPGNNGKKKSGAADDDSDDDSDSGGNQQQHMGQNSNQSRGGGRGGGRTGGRGGGRGGGGNHNRRDGALRKFNRGMGGPMS